MGSIIRGFVTKKDPDQRLPWGAVDLYKEGEPEPIIKSHADSQGEFDFQVAPGTYIISFLAPLYEPVRQRVEIGKDEEKTYEITTFFMGL